MTCHSAGLCQSPFLRAMKEIFLTFRNCAKLILLFSEINLLFIQYFSIDFFKRFRIDCPFGGIKVSPSFSKPGNEAQKRKEYFDMKMGVREWKCPKKCGKPSNRCKHYKLQRMDRLDPFQPCAVCGKEGRASSLKRRVDGKDVCSTCFRGGPLVYAKGEGWRRAAR